MVRIVWEYDSGAEIHGRLRRRLMSFMRRYGAPRSDFGGAELICGELIANAVRHAPGHVTVELEWSGDAPTLTIADGGPPFPIAPGLPPDALAETGRGLFIVRSLARKVELDSQPSDGTKITVELPVYRNPVQTRLTHEHGRRI
jgi:anti-sigma regulatory factor (Ser/Thr protein kinase)